MASVTDQARQAETGQSTERENGPIGSRFIAEHSGTGNVCSDVDGPELVAVHAFSRPDPSGGGAGCQAHSWVYAGRWHLPYPKCSNPGRMECAHCGLAKPSRCGVWSASSCAQCSKLKTQDLARLFMTGRASDGIGREFMITLTGPGADVLPWDPDRCSHSRSVPCSGKLGCRVDRLAAAEWHGTLSERHSHCIEYIRRDVERYLGMEGATGADRMQYAGAWEDQEREVLHRHMLARTPRPVPLKIMRRIVKAHAKRWGFGPQWKVEALREGTVREAWYIAKYPAKTVDSFAERPVLDAETGELKTGGIRPWSASWHWGETMKSMREARRQWAAAHAVAGGGSAARYAAGAAGGGLDPQGERSTLWNPDDWAVIKLLRDEGMSPVLL